MARKDSRGTPPELNPLESEVERAQRTKDETDAAALMADVEKPKQRRRMGHPVMLTPRMQQTIVDTIAKGNYQQVAAAAAGISRDTLQRWRARGKRGEQPYADLEKALEAAELDCEIALVAKVMGKTDEDWRASAHILERRFPERWSRARERALYNENFLEHQGFVIAIHLEPSQQPLPAITTTATVPRLKPPADDDGDDDN